MQQVGADVFERYGPHLNGADFVSTHVVLTILFEPNKRALIRVDKNGFEGIFNDLHVRVDYGENGEKTVSYPRLRREQVFISDLWAMKLRLEPETALAKQSSVELRAARPGTRNVQGPVTNEMVLWNTKWTAWYSWAATDEAVSEPPNSELLRCLTDEDRFVAAHLSLGQRFNYRDFVVIPETYGYRVIADQLHVKIEIDAEAQKKVIYPNAEEQMAQLHGLWAQRLLLHKKATTNAE